MLHSSHSFFRIWLLVQTEPTVQTFRYRSRCVEGSSRDFCKCHSIQDQQTDSRLFIRPHDRAYNHPIVLVLKEQEKSNLNFLLFIFPKKMVLSCYLSIGIWYENWFTWVNTIFLPQFLGFLEGVDFDELRIKFNFINIVKCYRHLVVLNYTYNNKGIDL